MSDDESLELSWTPLFACCWCECESVEIPKVEVEIADDNERGSRSGILRHLRRILTIGSTRPNETTNFAFMHSTTPSVALGGLTPKDSFDFYWRFVAHENALINYRFFWGVFVNAGLLTILAAEKVGSVFERHIALPEVAAFALVWNTLIAILCTAALISEHRSLTALDRILNCWDFPRMKNCGVPSLRTARGGGSKRLHWIGFICSMAVFWAIPFAWYYVLRLLQASVR